MSKESQIGFAKHNLRRHGFTGQIDLEAIIDSKLTFSENWKKIKRKVNIKSRGEKRKERRKYMQGE